MFDEEEKKEFAVDDVDFQSLVDVFGALQHHWPFSADRLHQLILIARRLGFDLWGPALSREFAQLVYRNEPVKIVAMEEEGPETFEFDEPLTWTIDDVSNITSSSSPPNQNVLLSSTNGDRHCIIYVYTQLIAGQQYLSLGFQMSRASTSSSSSSDDDIDHEDVDMEVEDVPRGFFDIHVHLVAENGESWIESLEEPDPSEHILPGIVNGAISCENTVIEVNKEYLCHHSAYFRGLFSDRFRESELDILDLPAESLEPLVHCLEMVYNRKQTLDDVQLSRVLDFADRTCMNSVTAGLERQLWSTEMNLDDKKWLADEFMLPHLK
uniref:BTB domain-containing protein n=1 Tax=Caenorhabditis japonica TaxID=281687 RepID=A0A8R1IC60_CAEJA